MNKTVGAVVGYFEMFGRKTKVPEVLENERESSVVKKSYYCYCYCCYYCAGM